ncbi:hypothetical protein AB6A40_006037 [Gnathostoma spinigerum]|uniref:MATH domain-containing protein n=1 Tax=Gnathostoma spinigerum TaxID=75299 RepID=A0ABD6EH82_9BILA
MYTFISELTSSLRRNLDITFNYGTVLVKKMRDCHEIVKTSAVAGERRGNLCTVHQNGIRRTKVHVACQTDSEDVIYPKITSCGRPNVTQLPISKNVPASGTTSASNAAETSSASSSSASDGTLRLMIQNFKNMGDTVRGPSKKIQTVPWRIMVMPRQHVVQKKGTQKCLGFFLQCCPEAYSDSWSCQAAAELRLISQKQGVPHFTRKTNHVYTAKENDWGYSCFMTWADILDESQGYIKEDKVILEVSVKAEPPKNILTHDQFEKKIQDYMRLADIQSSRGLIDKAIEVNLSALKFCKDRDQDCKAELEAQKAKLIEMKLKQSIERIEKGPPLGKGEEENCLNQNALKQAISGTPTSLKQSNAGKSSNKSSSNGRLRDNVANEKNGSMQPRPQTPPAPPKPANDIAPAVTNSVEDKKSSSQTENTVCVFPGITTTCAASGFSSTTTTVTKEITSSTGEVLASSPYRAPWTVQNQRPNSDNHIAKVDENEWESPKGAFRHALDYEPINDEDKLTNQQQSADDTERRVAERKTFIKRKLNELIRAASIKTNTPVYCIQENLELMHEMELKANDAYEEDLRRQSLKRLAARSIREAQQHQKISGKPNTAEMDNDLSRLGRLVEDPETVKAEHVKMGIADGRTKALYHKQEEIKKNKYEKECVPSPNPMWRVRGYKADLTGQKQPWNMLCDDGERTERLIEFSSDEESLSSGGEATSDSDTEGTGGPPLGVPVSKKMKRSLDDPDGLSSIIRDDCDSCIQALLEPSLSTQETSCQTDSTLFEAQPKFDDSEWRKKKGEQKETDGNRKKTAEETRNASGVLSDTIEACRELTKESIARDFANVESKIFQALPPIYPSPQLFGEDFAPQLQPYLDETSQPNVWSRQYIEEWLKFNIKYCWKYMKNGEMTGSNESGSKNSFVNSIPKLAVLAGNCILQNSPTVGDEGGIDLTSGNIPQFNDTQAQQVMAALSVIGVNCVNAKRVVDKAAEFINTLESRSKSPFLKDCLQKLAVLAGDEKAIEAVKEEQRKAKDSADCAITDDHSSSLLGEDSDDLNAIMSSMECPDDQHDYMLTREVHRIGVFADQAVSKNPLMEVGQAEKLNEHTEMISNRIATLENLKDSLTKSLAAEKEKSKKAEQKHANAIKQLQSQLQVEKEKHEKTMQQLNQKKNELKKQEKALKQHERDIERSRELQEKVESLTKEIHDLRQKHADDFRKLQRELQSSQDTRKNMAEELKIKEAELAEMKNQLTEKSLALKRSESALCCERKSFQNTVSSITERAKKAEIMYLEQRLETGVAVLERAYKDAGQRVRDLEAEQKKSIPTHPPEYYKAAIPDWKAKREEISALISTAKSEFGAQVDQIKAGKPLSQLPRISVARPPPPPKSPKIKMTQFSTQPAPIGAEKPVVAPPSCGVIGQTGRSSQAGVIGTPVSPNSVAPGSPVQPISKAPAPPASLSPMKSPITSIAPIGVRPSHNGSVDYAATSNSLIASSSSANNNQTTTSTPTSATLMGAPWGSGWETSLAMNSITELMNPSRSFGPIGTDYGIGSTAPTSQLSQPPPGLNTSTSHFGSSQSNGWGSSSTSDWSSSMSTQHGHYNQLQQSSAYQSTQWNSGWAGYPTPQSGGSPDMTTNLLDSSRSSSPKRDVLFESLRSNFPQISLENLKQYVDEFMNRNNCTCTSLKALPVNEVVNGVAQIINSKQLWSKSAIPPMLHQPPPNVLVQSPVGLASIDPYQSPPSRLHNQQPTLPSHVLMQQQRL